MFGWFCIFFFQAEDGIRDADVTGVQTCALPILIGEILAEEGATVVAEEVIGKLVEGEGAVAAAAPASTAPSASASSSGEKLEVKVPQLPESVADATVATWHVKPGDAVTRDQNLVDIETDKVVLEVVAAADGVLSEVLHAEGATVTAEIGRAHV